MKEPIVVVLFKRDLRIHDHAPLNFAAKSGLKVMGLFCFEPSIRNYYDWDLRHWQFQFQGLMNLKSRIPVEWSYEEIYTALNKISEKYEIKYLVSHQETGTKVTFDRDKDLKSWSRLHSVKWKEFQQGGVVRGLNDIRSWRNNFLRDMKRLCETPDLSQVFFIEDATIEFNHSLPESISSLPETLPHGGETMALQKMQNFFENFDFHKERFIGGQGKYTTSELSSYLSWGNLSLRMLYQQADQVRTLAPEKNNIDQFINRLSWRSYYIQKFEINEEAEFKNMDGGFDHIKYSGDKEKLLAWKEGKTGFPLVDASMRCVLVSGQVNFRLRGLLVSFLTHYLQCSWKEGARFLARKFIDYEPGIHFIQFQTQAGLALSEGIRIYDPVKQSKDKDPNGEFIKRWVPELVNLPKPFLHTPWKMSAEDQSRFRVILGEDYPLPVVSPEFPHELAQKLTKARSRGEKRSPKAPKRRD